MKKALFHYRLVLVVGCLLQVLPTNAFTVLKPSSFARTTRKPWQQQQQQYLPVASFLQASSSSTTTTAASNPPQVLTFEEPTTNVTVVLVGSMHYNPASIQLACDTIQNLAQENLLASVVIEACDVRWNNTQELHDQQPILKRVLENEMRASAQVSHEYNRPVVLGDQRINVTTTRLKSAFSETLRDLITLNWTNLYNDLHKAVEVALPSGPGYMDASGFIDLRLLLAAPVSLVKYPLSYIVRAPIASVVVLGVLLALDLPMAAETGDAASILSWQDWAGSIAFAVLEIIVFMRMFVNVLLAERNEVLARSILRQCQIYGGKEQQDKVQTNWWSRKLSKWFRPRDVRAATETLLHDNEDDIIYAPVPDNKDSGVDASVVGMSNARSSTAPQVSNKNDDEKKVVVAVMGMAHCNGVKKLLQENLVQ